MVESKSNEGVMNLGFRTHSTMCLMQLWIEHCDGCDLGRKGCSVKVNGVS
jgi:hypothetical protein